MKTILMLLESKFPPDVRVENEMDALTRAGFDVHVACYRKDGEEACSRLPFGVVHRTPVPRWIYKSSVGALKFPFYFAWWRRQVARLMKEQHFDAIHVHDLPLARVGRRMADRAGVPMVLDLHEIWPALLRVSAHTQTFLGRLLSSDSQWRRYELDMARAADRVVTVVDESRERLAGMGIPAEKITVVSNTLNLDKFQVSAATPPSPDQPLRLLYVGGVTFHRGLQYVLEALKVLKEKHVKVFFDLVGDGAYLPVLRRKAAELGVEDLVRFHGFRRYTEITDLYRDAHVALIPHIRSEHTDHTVPHKIFQYMYAQTPMLVSSCAPLVRIMKETGSGCWYVHDDVQDLAAQLERLTDASVWSSYTHHGREAVENKYNWQQDGGRLVSMYQQLLG